MAALLARHLHRAAARKLAALCRSCVLERRAERLRLTADYADFTDQKLIRKAGIPDRSFSYFLDFLINILLRLPNPRHPCNPWLML